jgi:NYN domain-containing protein
MLDLITLARERAMSTAYLISGDEDIREGVAAAQQMGVRVVLVGIPGPWGDPHQADTLVREADECVVLDRQAMIEPHIKPRERPIRIRKLEPPRGFEPRTDGLRNHCSTAELRRLASARLLYGSRSAEGGP